MNKDGKACRGQITKGLDCYIRESCLHSKGNGKPLRDFKQQRGLISVAFQENASAQAAVGKLD